jgi:hypothetical protein
MRVVLQIGYGKIVKRVNLKGSMLRRTVWNAREKI